MGQRICAWMIGFWPTGVRTIGVVFCAMLSACAASPQPVPASALRGSAVVSTQTQVLPSESLPPMPTSTADTAYLLGPNDVISVSVYNHPELSVPTPGTTSNSGGVLVTSDGSVNLPLIGRVDVGGKTIDQVQTLINNDYASTIEEPDVTVELVDAQSLRYYLLGAFTAPGVKFPGREMKLLDALALGGSVDLGNADLYQSYVANGSEKLPVDMHALLMDGDMSQDIVLASGDTVVIPPSTDENAFVFGAVGKPGAVPFRGGELSLLQALSESDLDLPNYTQARLSQVHLIRAHGTSAQFIVLDARKVIAGQALNFALEPGDILFVPPTEVASWNQVLDQLLPALNTVNGILNPFVSIKYLTQRTN